MDKTNTTSVFEKDLCFLVKNKGSTKVEYKCFRSAFGELEIALVSCTLDLKMFCMYAYKIDRTN